MLKGIAGSEGIGIGRVVIIEEHEVVIEDKTITDVDAEIQDMATQYQMKPEELKDMIGAPEMENIKKDIASRKALEFLGENCKEV